MEWVFIKLKCKKKKFIHEAEPEPGLLGLMGLGWDF
jgi:hypothetical protein